MDGNLKLILGMIWTLILRFTIADIKYVAPFLCLEVNSDVCLKRGRLV